MPSEASQGRLLCISDCLFGAGLRLPVTCCILFPTQGIRGPVGPAGINGSDGLPVRCHGKPGSVIVFPFVFKSTRLLNCGICMTSMLDNITQYMLLVMESQIVPNWAICLIILCVSVVCYNMSYSCT